MVLQLAHFLVALSLLCVAVVEFSAEAPLFDVLGTDRQAIPQPVRVVFQLQVSTCPTTLLLLVYSQNLLRLVYHTSLVNSSVRPHPLP